jgi:spermidine synthase
VRIRVGTAPAGADTDANRNLRAMSDQGRSADPAAGVLPHWLAVALVTGTSGAVLVLEILASRLLAPYVGVNIETYTAIIGTILAGIALGAWAGGAAADAVDPLRLIPVLLTVGGGLAIASIPIVRALGGDPGPGGSGAPSVLLALWGFGPSAAVLSAVPPAVVKLQLRDLGRTGTTVGRLSAWSTGGAIAGTFLAGYVLVAFAAVTTLIVTVGVVLIAAGVVLWLVRRIVPAAVMWSAGGLAALSLLGAVATDTPCDVQSTYYCIAIENDPGRDTGRVLVLDDLRHSYVDVADPGHLEFWYIRRIADAIDAYAPEGPVDLVAIGGGALTIPRWIEAERPGSRQTVLEIDPGLIELVDDEFGLPPVTVVTGDGRLSMRDVPDASADVVVGDAFGSRSVPWHLATEEFMADVARVLRPGGIYVANVIDGGDESFLRAEAATIATQLPEVGVLRGPGVVDGQIGNSVIVAARTPLDLADWDRRRRDGAGGELVTDLDAYLDGALVLTDDYAPVDQLIIGAR